MRFKTNSKEAAQYFAFMAKYIESLNAFTQNAEEFFKENPNEKSSEFLSFRKLNESISSHKKLIEAIYLAGVLGENVNDNFLNVVLDDREKIAKEFDALKKNLANADDRNLTEEEQLPLAGMLSIIENHEITLNNSFEPLFALPQSAIESSGASLNTQGKKPTNVKQESPKIKENPYRAEYLEEFERLAKELKKTNPWYSKGSESYQLLEGYIATSLNELKNCKPQEFDSKFKSIISGVNARASVYEQNHRVKALDKRQMNRLKIMNRFYLLGERYKDIQINPKEDYQSKIAEKYIHAMAINGLNRDPKDAGSAKILRNPAFLKKAIDQLAKGEAFQNSLPKSPDILMQKIKTNGLALCKELAVRIKAEEESLKIIKQFKQNTNPQRQAKTDNIPRMDDRLNAEEIEDYEKQFLEIERKQKLSSTVSFNGRNMGRSSTLSPVEKRQQRLRQNPNNGYDNLLSDPAMEQLEAQMLNGQEFSYFGAIPDEMKYCNSVEQFEEFKRNHPNLSDADRKYIDSHIATEKFYSNLEENRTDYEPIAPITQNDGTVILDHIHLDTLQTTNMGCYSCSSMLLLQSRGLNLDQRQIRNYRMEGSTDFFDDHERERTSGDVMGNIVNIGGIATRCLKNTALREKTYVNMNTASQATKDNIAADVIKSVKEAITIHRSPVSLLRDGHYVTIVGYNEAQKQFIYKNSLQDRDFYIKHPNESPSNVNPDEKHSMGIDELLDVNKLAIGYLITVNPEDPMKHFSDATSFEFVNGQYMDNNPALTGVTTDYENPDGKLIVNKRKLGDGVIDKCSVQSITKVPKRLDMTLEMKRNIGDKFKVKPLKDSPDKQALMVKIANAERELFPDKDSPISVSGVYDNDGHDWVGLQFKCGDKEIPNDQMADYMYLQKLKAKMDILTPWQVKHAFDHDRFQAARDGILKNDALQTLMGAKGKTVPLNTLADGVYISCKPLVQQQNNPTMVASIS